MKELTSYWLEQSKPWAKSGLVLFILVVIVWRLTAWLGQPSTMPIKHVRIGAELNYVAHEDISQALSTLVKTGYFSIDTTEIVNKLTAMEWVKKAHIRRVWPDTIVLIVEEQRPAAIWNKTALLNTDGEIFKPMFDRSTIQLPSLSGIDSLSQTILSEQNKINQSIESLGLSVKKLSLAEHGSWSAELNNGIKIKAGYGLPEKKISKSLLLLSSINERLLENLDSVDLRYPNGVAVMWREGYKLDGLKVTMASLKLKNNQPTKS